MLLKCIYGSTTPLTPSAIRTLEIQILDSHLFQCVTEAFQQNDQEKQKQKIEEIRNLIKRFT